MPKLRQVEKEKQKVVAIKQKQQNKLTKSNSN